MMQGTMFRFATLVELAEFDEARECLDDLAGNRGCWPAYLWGLDAQFRSWPRPPVISRFQRSRKFRIGEYADE